MLFTSELDAVLEEIISRWGIPGLAVGIVEGNEILYARAFGVQSLDTQAPVTLDSIFCLASIAKCFVAVAVMQLAEQGKIDLDAPLCQYLPDFRLADERCRQITIRQILSHTSGMPDMDEDEYDELVSHPEYDEGAARRYIRAQSSRKLVAAPGECFWYSNIGYNLLGGLIAEISGQTFEAYMKEHILIPVGMPNSTFFFPEVDRDRLAVPHLRIPEMIVNPIYPYHRADAPASFLHSTVAEMCRWGMACLNDSIYHTRRLLTPASYDAMWTPVVKRGIPPFYEDNGLGWVLGHFDGLKTVSHGGGGFGWTCFFTLLPEKNSAAIILCNEESSARSRTVRAAVHAILDRQPIVNTVSWMVPICRALQGGSIRAAYACYAELKDNPDYFFDAGELVTLVYQLMSVKKYDLAIDVLGLNLHVFPEDQESYLMLAKLYLHKGQRARAESALQKALAIGPGSLGGRELLDKINQSPAA